MEISAPNFANPRAGTAQHGAKLEAALAGYDELLAPVVKQLSGMLIDGTVAFAYASKVDPQRQVLEATLGALLAESRARVGATRAEARVQDHQIANAGMVGGALIMALLAGVMWVTYRSVLGPIEAAKALAGRIAAHDLSAHLPVQGRDELAELCVRWKRCRIRCARWSARCARAATASAPPAPRTPRATTICPAAPSRPRATCSRPPARWSS